MRLFSTVECARASGLAVRRPLARLHRDQGGSISVLSVVTLLMFTIVMGMLINVGRQVDDKVKLQNAADAATYSGGVVLSRGMNAIAFTNHLLAEVFALTAYMREGVRINDSPDRNTVTMAHQILDAWEELVPVFRGAPFPKFAALSPAIADKVPRERALVDTFGELTAAKAELTLPVFEYILGQPEVPDPPRPGAGSGSGGGTGGGSSASPAQSHLIPEFQRAVVQAVPLAAQLAMAEVARRHGPSEGATRTSPLSAVLWRARVLPVGDSLESDPRQRTLPAVDPSNEGPDAASMPGGELAPMQAQAVQWRYNTANSYLNQWLGDRGYDLGPFNREGWSEGGKISGKMSRMYDLWRIFTCGQLRHLLVDQFPTTNLPHMIRSNPTIAGSSGQQLLESDYTFIGVAYWPQKRQFFSGVFRTPTQGDALAFSQASLHIPFRRYQSGFGGCAQWMCPGHDYFTGALQCGICYDPWPLEWDLTNQNWTVKMVPATGQSLASVLQTSPPNFPSVQLPNLGGMITNEMKAINTH